MNAIVGVNARDVMSQYAVAVVRLDDESISEARLSVQRRS